MDGKPHRVSLGSIIIECNHLGGTPADLDRFRQCELRLGPEILEQRSGVVGGMLHVLGPAGRGRRAAAGRQRLSERSAHLGVLPRTEDGAARSPEPSVAGRRRPACRSTARRRRRTSATSRATCSAPSAQWSARGADRRHPGSARRRDRAHGPPADALLGWETYPHRDTFETGVRGASLLLDILDGKCRPTMAMAKVPVLVSAIHGNTEGDGPFADVMRFAKSHEGRSSVLSTSVFLVHPYLDLPGMGGGGLVITDGDLPKARSLAREIAMRYWSRRADLEPIALLARRGDRPRPSRRRRARAVGRDGRLLRRRGGGRQRGLAQGSAGKQCRGSIARARGRSRGGRRVPSRRPRS